MILIYFFSNGLFSQDYFNLSLKKQLVKYELAKRYLKLGNSWREAGNFELARIYLDKGFNEFQKFGSIANKYWFGVYYEYLGYLNRDEGNVQGALENLNQAKLIFDRHGRTKDDTGSDRALDKLIDNLGKEVSAGKPTLHKPIDITLIKENDELKSKIANYEKEIKYLEMKISRSEQSLVFSTKTIDSLKKELRFRIPENSQNTSSTNKITTEKQNGTVVINPKVNEEQVTDPGNSSNSNAVSNIKVKPTTGVVIKPVLIK